MPPRPRTFKGAGASSPTARRRAYDRTRPSAAKRLYGRAWRRARKAYLLEHPFCVDCGDFAAEVDHDKPHGGDLELFWDRDNWRGRCKPCHSRKTRRENAGKSTS